MPSELDRLSLGLDETSVRVTVVHKIAFRLESRSVANPRAYNIRCGSILEVPQATLREVSCKCEDVVAMPVNPAATNIAPPLLGGGLTLTCAAGSEILDTFSTRTPCNQSYQRVYCYINLGAGTHLRTIDSN